VSPTVLRVGHLRLYLFSREESRIHVHVEGPDGEAKFWPEPTVELATNQGLPERDLRAATEIIKEHEDELRSAWHRHFVG
jgi:hypothetical protein